MKRVSQGGNSPAPKHFLDNDSNSDSSEDFNLHLVSQTTSTESDHFVFPATSQGSSSQTSSGSEIGESTLTRKYGDWETSFPNTPEDLFETTEVKLRASLENHVEAVGVSTAAALILENDDIREEIKRIIFSQSHGNLKSSLKTSKLTSSKKDRRYLLSLTPKNLCEEFQGHSDSSFQLLVKGLLGISDQKEIFESQFLLNNIALLYSIIGRILNRNATGYALLLTTTARDGGLREDSLVVFPCLVHPRTSQRYDKEVLAAGWDTSLKDCLKEEKVNFEAQKETETRIEQLLHDDADNDAIEAAMKELEILKDSSPQQLQMVGNCWLKVMS